MRLNLSILALAAVSCAADPPLGAPLETKDLRLHVPGGEELCNGTADLLQAEYDRIASLYPSDPGEPPGRLDVVVGVSAAELHCGSEEALGGCAGDDERGELLVAGTLGTISHELVHAIRLQRGLYSNRFFEEGIAEFHRAGFLGNYSIGAPQGNPLELVDEFPTELSAYITAGSFVAYLASTLGLTTVLDATSSDAYSSAASPEQVRAWFEDAFQESLADTEDVWRAAAPFEVNRPGPCANERQQITSMQTFSGDVSCDSGGIGPFVGGSEVRTPQRCMELPEGTSLRIENRSPEGATLRLVTWLCDAVPRIDEVLILDAADSAELRDVCWVDAVVAGDVAGYSFLWAALPLESQ